MSVNAVRLLPSFMKFRLTIRNVKWDGVYAVNINTHTHTTNGVLKSLFFLRQVNNLKRRSGKYDTENYNLVK